MGVGWAVLGKNFVTVQHTHTCHFQIHTHTHTHTHTVEQLPSTDVFQIFEILTMDRLILHSGHAFFTNGSWNLRGK